MAHWNYRVMEFNTPDGSWRAIHEVHYDDEGRRFSDWLTRADDRTLFNLPTDDNASA